MMTTLCTRLPVPAGLIHYVFICTILFLKSSSAIASGEYLEGEARPPITMLSSRKLVS